MPWTDVKPENREVQVEANSQPRRPGRPARLSRAQILEAALELADRDGLEAVTMQRIAKAIGAEPMSLYRHVRNKEDLLDGLVDLVFAEIELPSPKDPWKVAMRRRAVSVREALGRHPWAIGLMESRTHPGPATLAYHDALLANLFAAGFTSTTGTRVTNIVDSYVYGFALQEKTLPVSTPEELAALGPEIVARYAGRYPHLERAATELIASGFRYGDEFEPGLDLILKALKREP